MVCVRQGTERSLALPPHPVLPAGICFLLRGSCRGAAGDGMRGRAARRGHCHLLPGASHGQPCSIPNRCNQRGLLFGKEGSWDQARQPHR